MKKRNILVLICILCTLLYFFLVPTPLGKERYLTLEWERTITPADLRAGGGDTAAGPYTPVVMKDFLCYINNSGNIAYAETKLKRAAAGSDYFINYSSIPERLLIKDAEGNITATADTRGYPYIRSDRLFVVHQDRCGISEYTREGELVWRKRFASLVTAFDASDSAAVIGLLDGRLVLLDHEGRNLFDDTFQGGTHNAVYGCTVNGSGNVFAAVVGSGPQRFVLYEKLEGEYRLFYSRVLDSDYRRESYIRFLHEDTVGYEQEGSLTVFRRDKRRPMVLPVLGRVVEVRFDASEKLFYILSAEAQSTILTVYETTGRKLTDYRFPETAHLFEDGDSLFLSTGNTVYKIKTARI